MLMDAEPPVNILLVDDEPANLVVLETLLDDPAYRLVRAESGDQALLAMVEQEFALVILDVRMPGMTGFELAQLIKERKKTAGVPIIFLTAYYDKDQHALEGYSTGAVDFLGKPVNATVLRSKVAVFVDLHRKTRAAQLSNQALLVEVAERRRAEHQLKELNESLERRVEERTSALLQADRKLQTLMASITDGLLMLDTDWCFTFINDQGAHLLGKSREALLSTSIWSLFPGAERSPLWDGLHKAIALSRAQSFEVFHRSPSERWLECHCYPSDEGVSLYFHDISDRHEMEQRQRQLLNAEQAARAESERVARAKDEFLASLSHELRTPLAAILGWAKIISQPGTDPDVVSRGLDAIARNAQVQSQVVSDLLDMGRIVSGKLRITLERVNLNEIAAAAADTARPAAQAKGVRLELRLHADSLELVGDPSRLQQVVSNLVSNALKFTLSGGTVTISTACTASEVHLIVADTGEGIAPEFVPRLFDKFSQADSSDARQHGGLGLGLAIVKNIVEGHQGSIDVDSERGLGSTFKVRLPRSAKGTISAPSQASSHANDALQGVSLLMVDDHADTLELHTRVLMEHGASVSTASTAEQALELLKQRRFDMLLSDLGMPGTDGYGLIREVRTSLAWDAKHLPALAVTAFAREADRDLALQAGYQACISKPVYPSALIHAVTELARRRDASGVLRVLYVEDHADLRELMSWLLRNEGLDVVDCATAEDAEAKFLTETFDVLLTDINLKGASGVQLARRMLATRPDARIVFCSGYLMEHGLTELGPNVRSLPKPFEPEDLWHVLEGWFPSRRSSVGVR